jgi:hypothetical protein
MAAPAACASLGRIDAPACRESSMNAQLNYILARQRIADLQRAADHARLATDAGTRRRDSRDSNPIVRALPMPTAHPSPEAWPDAHRAAREMLLAVAPDHTPTREGKQVQMYAHATVPGGRGHGSVPVDPGTGPNTTDAPIGGHRCHWAGGHAHRPARSDLPRDTATQHRSFPSRRPVRMQPSTTNQQIDVGKLNRGKNGHETQTC